MPTSVESSSLSTLHKGSSSLMCLSPTFSPSSDKRFWSNLRTRIDTILENRKPVLSTQLSTGNVDRTNRLKDDSLLLLRGVDSVAYSLSQLSNNLDNALQGARDLTGTPTSAEIVKETVEEKQEDETESGELKRGLKRKLDSPECSSDDQKQSKQKQIPAELEKLNKAKNIAISMAKRAASLAREMKSIKSDLCFMQERFTLLEEENRKLRDGVVKGIRPEEDDLVRLQMEALLGEKSRLANENANLKRENLSLNQLVEYHQITSQDPCESESYDDVIRGMYLDFSSPLPEEEEEDCETPKTPHTFLN